jgi:hypothetical protein
MNADINKTNASVRNEASVYETPTILALGGVAALTLGTAGHDSDNCGCSLPNVQIRLF